MKDREAAFLRAVLTLMVGITSIAILQPVSAETGSMVVVKFIGYLVTLALFLFLCFYRTPTQRAKAKLRKRKLEATIAEVERGLDQRRS